MEFRRKKWGRHYRIVIYENGKMVSSTRWSPKEGLTVKNLKQNPEAVLHKLPQKAKEHVIKHVSKKRLRELKKEERKYRSAYVDYVFRDWFETKDKNKKTRVTYEVHFTTLEKQPFHDNNELSITDIFTAHLKKGTYNFMRDVLGIETKRGRKLALPFAHRALDAVHGTCNVVDIDYRVTPVPFKIRLEDVTDAEFKIMKNGRTYDYSLDYKFYIEDYVEDAISEIRMLG